jgi:hypothetical protein
MDANIRSPNCKQATLSVELFGHTRSTPHNAQFADRFQVL